MRRDWEEKIDWIAAQFVLGEAASVESMAECLAWMRQEADREGQCAQHRHAQRIDDGVRQTRPEIHGAGDNRALRRMAHAVENEHKRGEHHQVVHGIGMREIESLRPGALRLVVAGRIGHGPHQAAHDDAVDDIGNPQDAGQDHRQRQP